MTEEKKSKTTIAVPEAVSNDILLSSGALLEGHFLLSSGLHSDRYFQCATLLEDPRIAEKIALAVADVCRYLKPDVVLAPALGAVVFGYELARQLGVRSIFAERPTGKFELRRGFALRPGDRVLMAENVTTTGVSVLETAELARSFGAEVLGYAMIVDRTRGRWTPPEPMFAYALLNAATYAPEACPMCASGGKPVKPGSRCFK